MKIKILKDIPGLEKGSVHEKTGDNYLYSAYGEGTQHRYYCDYLIKYGYAEEVKEIDIDAIRACYKVTVNCLLSTNNITSPKVSEVQWFSAYRVVSEVIRQLNQTYIFPCAEALCENAYEQTEIYWREGDKTFYTYLTAPNKENILPVCYSEEIAKKVIDLCTPELLTLFNVK